MNTSQLLLPKVSTPSILVQPGERVLRMVLKVLRAIGSGVAAHRAYRTLVLQGVAEREAASESISRSI